MKKISFFFYQNHDDQEHMAFFYIVVSFLVNMITMICYNEY